MATAIATPTITLVDNTQKITRIYGTLAITASPATYATGGLICSFANFDLIKSNEAPTILTAVSAPAAGTSPSGYVYQFCSGTTMANGKLAILQASAAGTIGAITPAGTIGGNVTVVGGAIGEAVGINPDSNAGVLSKAAATNRTIPIATLLGAAPTFSGIPVTPAFTGTAGALVELTNSGAIPAAVSGDVIVFVADFLRL